MIAPLKLSNFIFILQLCRRVLGFTNLYISSSFQTDPAQWTWDEKYLQRLLLTVITDACGGMFKESPSNPHSTHSTHLFLQQLFFQVQNRAIEEHVSSLYFPSKS